jgi:lambda family phage portal protein
MGIFDSFFKKPEEPSKGQPFRRSYAAANTGRLFADFVGSERSSDSELYPVLNRMRARTRDLSRNNEYVKRYLELMKANVVGERGFTLQVKAIDTVGKLDQQGNQSIEDAFKMWGRLGSPTVDGKMTWVDAQKLAIESLARDGEVIIVKHRGSSFKDSFAFQFIEPDQLDEKKNERLPNGNEIRMGVELDKFKKPVAYYFLTYHPGDYDFATQTRSPKHTRIPADRVIHVFMPLRAGQTRGEPWMAPALPALKQLGALREAAIINARVGASKMGFFTSPAGDGFVADDMDGAIPIMDASPGTFHQLPNGVDFKTFDPQYPSNEFEDFHTAVLRGISSGLGVSYTSLSNDLEGTSYSSIRQGALEERDFYKNLQGFFVDHFVRPVYESWLAASMEINSFGIPIRQFDRFAAASEFRGRAWSWVDPQKEMNAAVAGLQNGVLSLQDVASQYGKDTEELLAQIQRDKALMEQFGVKFALEPYGSQKIPLEADVTDDGDV